jgi:hypothetical protein
MTLPRPGWLKLAGAALLALLSTASAQDAVTLRHVHGLGYSADGTRILIPSHRGLALYTGERWSVLPGPAHDYMGFAVTRDFIYTSGHFAPGRGVDTSLGLIRSPDDGQSWSSLGFEREAEFHLVAAGYESNALYVYNVTPNSRMPQVGLHRMIGGGQSWRNVSAQGMRGEPVKLAVHPTDEAMLAAVTSEGLFLSRNGGEDFKAIVEGAAVRTAYFPLDGDSLWFGTFDGRPGLFRIPIKNGPREEVALPPLRRDAVAYIAQNPARRTEFAIVTFERAVFLSSDRGATWRQIAAARGIMPDSQFGPAAGPRTKIAD